MTAANHVAACFAALRDHRAQVLNTPLRTAFENDKNRFANLHVFLDDMLFDFSRQNLDAQTLDLLEQLAHAADLHGKREAMFRGDIINATEKRAVWHVALRDLSSAPLNAMGREWRPEIEETRNRMLGFAESVRNGDARGATGEKFTAVVNIGIGGSDLGPAMAARVLKPFAKDGLRSLFVSNVDGADIGEALEECDPATTLFIVSSKTFTTQETMANAGAAKAFIEKALGPQAVSAHFAAVSTRVDKAGDFGVTPERVFGFWDWVGGRYSIWSSIGLPLAIAIGKENYLAFLQGAHDMDVNFRNAPLRQNIPVLMGLISIWNRNILGHASQAVIPYDQRLLRFAAYLQQLQMESSGKGVTLDGQPVQEASGPIVWGEPGTNGQHAFFQLLHQGTEIAPVDFLVAANPVKADAGQHNLLLANCLAQGEALMRGRTQEEARAITAKVSGEAEGERLGAHKTFPGSRPSSTLLYRQLTPRTLGRLIALYEHKVFVEAAIWNINAFDQWGVELGKELANQLAPVVNDASADISALNPSTAGLIGHIRALRG